MNKLILYIFNSKIFTIASFLLLFSLITFLTFKGISKFDIKPKTYYVVEHLKNNKNIDYDIFFFGNSMVFNSYDPLLLESLTGLKSLHFGTPGRKFALEPFVINEVIKIQNPKVVVVDISSYTMKAPNKKESIFFNEMAISSFSLSLNKILQLNTFKEDKYKVFLRTTSKLTDILYRLTTKFDYNKKTESTKGALYGFNTRYGHTKKYVQRYNKKFDRFYDLPVNIDSTLSNTIDKLTMGKLLETISYFKENKDTRIIFISSVKVNATLENQFFIDWLKNEIKDYSNMDVLELNTRASKEKLGLNYNDFSNANHPNKTGTYKLTSFFAQYLKDKVKFPSLKKYQFNYSNDKSGIILSGFTISLDQNMTRSIRVVIDSISPPYHNCTMIVSLHPKESDKQYISEYSKKKGWGSDSEYLPSDKFVKLGSSSIGRGQVKSKLTKDQLDHMKIWFWNSKTNKNTNMITITL